MTRPHHPLSMASDPDRLDSFFGVSDALPLWVAETYVPVADPVIEALARRAADGWYGYEVRPDALKSVFWDWMEQRHSWVSEGLSTIVSPSVGTSIGVLVDQLSDPGDGVIIQPPVFTDFKPLITSAGRTPIRNALVLGSDGYMIDLEHLAAVAADPTVKVMVLCNPHNPVGRAWSRTDLRAIAEICAAHGVTVVADEIHADLVVSSSQFMPFAQAAEGIDMAWAATHGPIKTFGLAGLCDSLLITNSTDIAAAFKGASNRLHLTRTNVFSTVAFEAAYRHGGPWLEDLVGLIESNVRLLREQLHSGITVMPHEATYLAWLDFRDVGLDVRGVADLISLSGVAMSPGHWFGREGAGFARMSIAAPFAVIDEAIERINGAVAVSRP